MIEKRSLYENIRLLIVWLGLTEVAWIVYWLSSVGNAAPEYTGAIIFWAVSMLIWLFVASVLGKRGVYLRGTRYFSNLIGFVSVIIFSALIFGLNPIVLDNLIVAAKNIPDLHLTGIHILRLLAVGTIIKYLQKELPLHFLICGALTDLFFAISAIVVTIMVANGTVSKDFLVGWHIFGSLVFMGAGVSMFFSMPSLFRITHKKPDATIVFLFPMILAPNYTVPLFVVMHGIALVNLLMN